MGLFRLRVFFGPLRWDNVRFLDWDFEDDADLVIELVRRLTAFGLLLDRFRLAYRLAEPRLERLVSEIDRDPWV